MHDLNLQLAKICILLLAKFFIIKVFKNSEVKDTGNKLTSVYVKFIVNDNAIENSQIQA